MKIFLIFISFVSVVFATPTWYYNIQNTKQNNYIGYGSASSEQEAKQNALVDISAQIYTKIDNKLIQNKTIVDGKYQKDTQTKSAQTTKVNLSGYELLKMKYKDGQYFVAIEYENIPSIQKFKNKLKSKNIKINFDNYLKEFNLVRKDNKWYIKYQEIMQVLDTKNFNKFFTTIPNKNLTITTNKKNNILYDGDEFYFKVNSIKKGFVTIFTVYEDGTVSILLQNIPIDKNKLANIPDKDFEAVPIAGLIEKGVETFDMYVAVYSSKKMILDNFARAEEELIDDERYKNFDELVEFIKDKTYTTLKVVTKPR